MMDESGLEDVLLAGSVSVFCGDLNPPALVPVQYSVVRRCECEV